MTEPKEHKLFCTGCQRRFTKTFELPSMPGEACIINCGCGCGCASYLWFSGFSGELLFDGYIIPDNNQQERR